MGQKNNKKPLQGKLKRRFFSKLKNFVAFEKFLYPDSLTHFSEGHNKYIYNRKKLIQ